MVLAFITGLGVVQGEEGDFSPVAGTKVVVFTGMIWENLSLGVIGDEVGSFIATAMGPAEFWLKSKLSLRRSYCFRWESGYLRVCGS